MSLDNLPVEWMNVKISDITVKGEQRKPNDSEEFIYVDIGSINRDLKKIESPQFLLGKDAPSRARKVIKKGDVLVSLTRPNLNAVALVGENYDQQIASTGFEVISPMIVESKYLFSLVRTQNFINEISKQEQGALYPAAKSSDVQVYEFPLPPLAEQQEIVRQLDVMLAQVEQIKARLDAIPAILKKFRQSVLADAVSGKLTEEWREKNAVISTKDLLQQIQAHKKEWVENNADHPESKRIKKRLKEFQPSQTGNALYPKTWHECCLEDIVLMIVDCHNKTAPYVESGIPLIRTSNIRDGKVRWEDLRFVDEPTYEYWSRRAKPESGDLIFTREAPMGEVCIIPDDQIFCLGQRTMLIKPIHELCIKNYLLLNILSDIFKKRNEEFAIGTGVKHYRVGDVSNFKIPLAPLEEQKVIVQLVSKYIGVADHISNLVESAQKRVNLLTQSILAKAFSGELTAEWREQHQDLITGVNSAETLLAKIQAEREVSKPVKKTRVKKEA